jgi:hypothetical protein
MALLSHTAAVTAQLGASVGYWTPSAAKAVGPTASYEALLHCSLPSQDFF